MKVELEGKVALVTGASAGIGLAICRRLVAQGARVVLVARTAERLAEAATVLGGGERAIPMALDVADLDALEALPRRIVERCGRLDVVVNNAGLHRRGAVADRSAAELAAMVTVNLTAPVVLSRSAVPFLPRGGAILNVASLAGRVPVPGAATYSATKAGLRAFGRALGDELRPRGISVCTLDPGPVDTDFFLGELDELAPITFSQPMSTPDEVAAAAIRCLQRGTPEIAIPWASGKLTTLGYLAPALMRLLRPWMERIGARKKAAYIARKVGR